MIETVVKERPILFSGSMVRAILEGRKTVTRRVVKPQPVPVETIDTAKGLIITHHDKLSIPKCPYGAVGDRLWVRETWLEYCGIYFYQATDRDLVPDSYLQFTNPPRWKPSIHMPRKASRITLDVIRVSVERLQDITEEQAIAEGVDQATCPVMQIGNSAAGADWVGGFKKLWDGINSDRPGCNWESNPWVWAVEFKKVEG